MYFTKDHEWLTVTGETATMGITAYASDQLGDIVFVELPAIGRKIAKGEAFAVVESVKAASDIYAPLSGTILSINENLAKNPDLVNAVPENEGWLVTFQLNSPTDPIQEGLMTRKDYEAYLSSL